MVKVVHGVAEEGRVAIRNVRRDIMSDLRELKKEGEAGEDDERRAEAALQKQTDERDRRDRRSAQGQGRRDPRGLRRPPQRDRAQIRSDHHRRQRPLGAAARSAGRRGAPGRRRHAEGAAARRGRAGDRGADRLLVLDRELEPARGGGPRPAGDDGRADRLGNAGAEGRRRADALHRPPRGARPGAGRADAVGRSGDRRQRPHRPLRRLQLRRQGGDPRRGAKLPGRAPRRSSAATSTRRRCTTPTC